MTGEAKRHAAVADSIAANRAWRLEDSSRFLAGDFAFTGSHDSPGASGG